MKLAFVALFCAALCTARHRHDEDEDFRGPHIHRRRWDIDEDDLDDEDDDLWDVGGVHLHDSVLREFYAADSHPHRDHFDRAVGEGEKGAPHDHLIHRHQHQAPAAREGEHGGDELRDFKPARAGSDSEADEMDHALGPDEGHPRHGGLGEAMLEWHWVRQSLSLAHAAVGMACYAALCLMVVKDKSTLSLSVQSLLAFAVTEVASAWTAGRFYMVSGVTVPRGFWLVDVPNAITSSVLVVFASKAFGRAAEEYDTFGLNLMIRAVLGAARWKDALMGVPRRPGVYSPTVLSFISAQGAFPADVEGDGGADDRRVEWLRRRECATGGEVVKPPPVERRAGRMRPSGPLGSVMRRTYWIILYLLAVPIALGFLWVRRESVGHTAGDFADPYFDAVRALALVPQLYMFSLQDEPCLSQQLAVLVAGELAMKTIALAFWICIRLTQRHHWATASYHIAVQGANFCLLSFFIWKYLHGKVTGLRPRLMPARPKGPVMAR